MASQKIKGIVVEIGGDTQKLDKALRDVNGELKTTQGELKDVDRLLKIDPGNIEALEMKQRNLNTAMEATKKKLDVLKQAAEQAKRKLEIGEISQEQYDALRRSVIKTEKSLEGLEDQAAESGSKLGKFKGALKDAGIEADGFKAAADKVTVGIGAIAAAAVASVPATEEFRDDIGKLKTNIKEARLSIEGTEDQFKKFNAITGEVDSSVEAVSNLLQAGFNDDQMTQAVDALAGAVIRFPDTLKLESLADSIQETIASGTATGQYAELLDRLGIGADTATEAMQGLTTEQRQWVALDLISRSGLEETYAEWQKNNGALISGRDSQLELNKAVADFAEQVTPLVTQITDLATAFLTWFNNLSDGSQNAIATIGLLILAFKPVSKVVDGAFKAFDLFTSGALTPMQIKIMAVVAALALVAGTIAAVSQAWGNMTGGEKVVAVLGSIAAAAAIAAVALGALTGPAGAAIAAAAIIGGIGVALAAVKSANGRANTAAVQRPGGQATQADVSRQQSPAPGGYGGGQNRGGNQPIIMQLDGATVGRAVTPYIDAEHQRQGVRLG